MNSSPLSGQIIETDQQRRTLRDLAIAVRDVAESLRGAVNQIAGTGIDGSVETMQVTDDGMPTTFNQLAGNLRQCLKFIDKSRRDVPLIAEKVGIAATPKQRDRIHVELARIVTASVQLLQNCESLVLESPRTAVN